MVPWAPRVLNPKDILIRSAVFVGLTTVTDRQTDRPTDHDATRSVTIGHAMVRPYSVRSTRMRPYNNTTMMYGSVIMTIAIARVHPVHLMNTYTERRVTANPKIKPTDLGCESADKWLLLSTSTIAICYY